MNRRSFFRNAAVALAGFTILPGAGRIWKATPRIYWEEPVLYARCSNNAYDTVMDRMAKEAWKNMHVEAMVKYYKERYARNS